MTRVIFLMSMFAVSVASQPSHADRLKCVIAMDVAGRSYSLSWYEMYSAFHTFRDCDDGSIASGFSNGVVHILARKWETLPQLQEFIAQDEYFHEFVMRHIDGTTDPDDLDMIISNLDTCPNELETLCRQIRANTEVALSEM